MWLRELNENYVKTHDFIEDVVVKVRLDSLNNAIKKEIEELLKLYNVDYRYNNDIYSFIISDGHSVTIETYDNVVCIKVFESNIKSAQLSRSTIRVIIDWDSNSGNIAMFVRGRINEEYRIDKIIDNLVEIRPIISDAILSCFD